MQRRQFLGVLSLAGLTALTGGASAHDTGLAADEFSAAPTWIGTAAARPAATGHHLDGLKGRIVYIARDTGAISYIEAGDSRWTDLPTTLPTVASADLPGPTTVPMGYMVLDGDRLVPTWNDGEAWESPTFVDNDDVIDTPVTVSNESAETELYRVQTGENAMVHKRVFILRIFGTYNTENSSSNCRLRVYTGPEGFTIGGGNETIVADISTVEENVTDGPWQIKVTMTVRSTGASGQLATHAEASFNNNKADDHEGAATVDTTTASGFAVTVEWGADASTGNSLTLGQAYLQQAA